MSERQKEAGSGSARTLKPGGVDTVDIWTPIKGWVLGSRTGPGDALLCPGMKVWDQMLV